MISNLQCAYYELHLNLRNNFPIFSHNLYNLFLQRCNLCQMSVYGNISKHRTSSLHMKLKTFIHPVCETCDQQFSKRSDWDEHKLSADHLAALEKGGKNQVETEYYEFMPQIGQIGQKAPGKAENVKGKEDPLEVERAQETAQLVLSKVAEYEIPTFDESKMIGKFRFEFTLRRVDSVYNRVIASRLSVKALRIDS